MNKDYEESRKQIYSLEFIRSDLYAKKVEFQIKNPTADFSPLDDKLYKLEEVQKYLHNQYEIVEDFKKKMYLLEITNTKLLAELITHQTIKEC